MDQKRVVSCVFRNRDLALLIVEVGIRGIIGNCAKRIGASAGSGKPHFPSLLSRPEGGYVVFLTFGVDENHVQFDLVERSEERRVGERCDAGCESEMKG